MSALVIATTRGTIADYVYALFLVYSVIIVIYVLSSLVFSLGVRVPYSRWSDAVLGFLRDVCEPYLRIFRRFIPMIGPLDISPIVALIVLSLVGSVVARPDPRLIGGRVGGAPRSWCSAVVAVDQAAKALVVDSLIRAASAATSRSGSTSSTSATAESPSACSTAAARAGRS